MVESIEPAALMCCDWRSAELIVRCSVRTAGVIEYCTPDVAVVESIRCTSAVNVASARLSLCSEELLSALYVDASRSLQGIVVASADSCSNGKRSNVNISTILLIPIIVQQMCRLLFLGATLVRYPLS